MSTSSPETAPASAPAAPWPRVPRWLTLRNSVRAARDPIGLSLDPLLARYGDTVHQHLGGLVPIVATRDPALIGHILQKNHRRYHKSDLTHGLVRYLGRGLLTNEGADWLRQRRLVQPGFHRQRLAGLTRLMQTVADEWLAGLDEQIAPGQTQEVDLYAASNQVTFRLIARAIFGDSLDATQLSQLSQWLTQIQAFYVQTLRQPYARPWLWLTGQYRRHDRLAARLRALVQGAVARHRAAHPPGAANAPDTLLQMLLDARYEDTGAPMEEAQLIDELNILLVAGHETSANTLAWGSYLLAEHPAEQARVRAEIGRELAPDQAPGFDDLARLPTALHIIQETMRLYPPAWIVDRVAREDDEFQGQPIPKGTVFSLYLYGLHHHPALWPAPEEFRPARFAPGAPPPPAGAYLPFGAGPRLCVGAHFALTSLQLVLLGLLRRYALAPVPGAPVPLKQPLITLRPAGALWLRLSRLA